jgi:hypothetical protein
MWQYDYAHQQFANENRYGFFSTFRRTYPARNAFCGTLHLVSSTCQRMIATHLLEKMLGHTTNPATIPGTASAPLYIANNNVPAKGNQRSWPRLSNLHLICTQNLRVLGQAAETQHFTTISNSKLAVAGSSPAFSFHRRIAVTRSPIVSDRVGLDRLC